MTARDLDMLGASDEEQLALAAASGRAVYTHNIRDYKRLAADWAKAGREHAGILYSSDHPIAQLRDWIIDALERYPEMRNLTLGLPLRG